jgi:hypothetical protein
MEPVRKLEQWIKEGKQTVKMTRLSCHRFRSNEVRLWLSVIPLQLGQRGGGLVLPKGIETWPLTSLQRPATREYTPECPARHLFRILHRIFTQRRDVYETAPTAAQICRSGLPDCTIPMFDV